MIDKSAIEELAKAQAITAANEALGDEVSMTMGLVALPTDFTVQDLETYLPNRRHARGAMTTSVLDEFSGYVTRFAEGGAYVFVDADAMKAVGVLNLGTTADPGHADNLAVLAMRKTAAYKALCAIANGSGKTQKDVAEYLEDWQSSIDCANDAGAIPVPKAVAAVRRLSIEAIRKLESTEAQLSSSRSAFEQVSATSVEPLPTTICLTIEPYLGLYARTFVLRLGVLTGGDKPAINLRVVHEERHAEEMAEELAARVRGAVRDVPVAIGTYAAGR